MPPPGFYFRRKGGPASQGLLGQILVTAGKRIIALHDRGVRYVQSAGNLESPEQIGSIRTYHGQRITTSTPVSYLFADT